MTTITSEDYVDVIFDMKDGRSILVMVSKVGTYRLMERTADNPWSPSVEGTVIK